MTTMKDDISNAKETLQNLQKIRESAASSNNESQKLALLGKENKVLRETLKKMNSSLNRFIEVLKDHQIKKMAKPKYGMEDLPVEHKLRTRDAEDMNYQKMVQNMTLEHESLQKRLEVVGKPNYSMELRRQNMEIKQQIRSLEEERRKLRQEKFQREKKINKVLIAGQPDSMLEIQKKVQEMTVIYDRLDKVNKNLDFQKSTQEESQRKYEETQKRLQELEHQAQQANIDVNNLSEDPDFDYDLSKDPNTYDRKEKILKQALETDRQMYSKVLDDLRQKLVTLLKEKNDIVQNIKEKQVQTTEKRKEFKELMIKSKLISESDAEKFDQDNEDSELPEETSINQDELVSKLNSVIKKSKKAVTIRKNTPSHNKT